jgi:lysophospholipase L1-like esterase
LYDAQYTLGTDPPYMIDNGAAAGCGVTNGALLMPWSNPGATYTDPGACALWAEQLQWLTSRFHPDVSVLETGYWESQDRLYDGSFVTLSNPGYASFIQSNLQQAVNILHSEGGAVLLATSPLFNDGTPNSLVEDFNQIVQNVATANSSFVTVLPIYSLLDPGGSFSTDVNGIVARTPDGVHLTDAGVTQLLDGTLNQLISSVGQPIYNGTS